LSNDSKSLKVEQKERPSHYIDDTDDVYAKVPLPMRRRHSMKCNKLEIPKLPKKEKKRRSSSFMEYLYKKFGR